jgi:hypothetical protein
METLTNLINSSIDDIKAMIDVNDFTIQQLQTLNKAIKQVSAIIRTKGRELLREEEE